MAISAGSRPKITCVFESTPRPKHNPEASAIEALRSDQLLTHSQIPRLTRASAGGSPITWRPISSRLTP